MQFHLPSCLIVGMQWQWFIVICSRCRQNLKFDVFTLLFFFCGVSLSDILQANREEQPLRETLSPFPRLPGSITAEKDELHHAEWPDIISCS